MPNDLCEMAEMSEAASSETAGEPARSRLLHHYQAIAQASCAMLAAARADDWNEVARQEERCGALIAMLKAADEYPESMSRADDECRMRLLRQILTDDALIRRHAEPWLEPVVPWISTPRTSGSDEPA